MRNAKFRIENTAEKNGSFINAYQKRIRRMVLRDRDSSRRRASCGSEASGASMAASLSATSSNDAACFSISDSRARHHRPRRMIVALIGITASQIHAGQPNAATSASSASEPRLQALISASRFGRSGRAANSSSAMSAFESSFSGASRSWMCSRNRVSRANSPWPAWRRASVPGSSM